MRDTVPRFASVYGVCVTLAILLTTGCSTVQRTPMAFVDLDHFKVDCRKKGEQIAFLQSMRPTPDEKLFAGVTVVAADVLFAEPAIFSCVRPKAAIPNTAPIAR